MREGISFVSWKETVELIPFKAAIEIAQATYVTRLIMQQLKDFCSAQSQLWFLCSAETTLKYLLVLSALTMQVLTFNLFSLLLLFNSLQEGYYFICENITHILYGDVPACSVCFTTLFSFICLMKGVHSFCLTPWLLCVWCFILSVQCCILHAGCILQMYTQRT